LHVPSMEGLGLGSEARMQPLDACRSVTTFLADGDIETGFLNRLSIARLCMRLLTSSWLIEALCLCFVFGPYLPEETSIALLFFGASAPCCLRRNTTMQPKSLRP
jgi:hypothetical protein